MLLIGGKQFGLGLSLSPAEARALVPVFTGIHGEPQMLAVRVYLVMRIVRVKGVQTQMNNSRRYHPVVTFSFLNFEKSGTAPRNVPVKIPQMHLQGEASTTLVAAYPSPSNRDLSYFLCVSIFILVSRVMS